MGINAKMAVAMMIDAGMGENAIIAAFAQLEPIATFSGSPYYDPTTVSRLIHKMAV